MSGAAASGPGMEAAFAILGGAGLSAVDAAGYPDAVTAMHAAFVAAGWTEATGAADEIHAASAVHHDLTRYRGRHPKDREALDRSAAYHLKHGRGRAPLLYVRDQDTWRVRHEMRGPGGALAVVEGGAYDRRTEASVLVIGPAEGWDAIRAHLEDGARMEGWGEQVTRREAAGDVLVEARSSARAGDPVRHSDTISARLRVPAAEAALALGRPIAPLVLHRSWHMARMTEAQVETMANLARRDAEATAPALTLPERPDPTAARRDMEAAFDIMASTRLAAPNDAGYEGVARSVHAAFLEAGWVEWDGAGMHPPEPSDGDVWIARHSVRGPGGTVAFVSGGSDRRFTELSVHLVGSGDAWDTVRGYLEDPARLAEYDTLTRRHTLGGPITVSAGSASGPGRDGHSEAFEARLDAGQVLHLGRRWSCRYI